MTDNLNKEINNNYSPKWRWLIEDIYGGHEPHQLSDRLST